MSPSPQLIAEWPLSPSATLGSAVRSKGIEREVRARLPWAVRKHVKAETGRIALRMSRSEAEAFKAASASISKTLEGVEALPVLPREVEDILTISSRERHKWLKDGRLQSTGTRTVKMRGRSKSAHLPRFRPAPHRGRPGPRSGNRVERAGCPGSGREQAARRGQGRVDARGKGHRPSAHCEERPGHGGPAARTEGLGCVRGRRPAAIMMLVLALVLRAGRASASAHQSRCPQRVLDDLGNPARRTAWRIDRLRGRIDTDSSRFFLRRERLQCSA